MTTQVTLPNGFVWHERSFPNANFLMLLGQKPTLIDSGFVAHAEQTLGLAHEHTSDITTVVNTHWHSDHIGANAVLQQQGAQIIGSHFDAEALDQADPGCCLAEYLDQPVPSYTVDHCIDHGDRLLLGDSEWEIIAVPGHTPGHIALWNDEHQLLAVGDTLSTYDVGWVNILLEGTEALDRAVSSLRRLREYDARLILPGHGPIADHPEKALNKAIERLERQQSNLELSVNYGIKRILAYVLMLRGGMTTQQLDEYLPTRDWVYDAARLLNERPEDVIRNLVDSMLSSGALSLRNGTIYAATESTPVDPEFLELPLPRNWNRPKTSHTKFEPKELRVHSDVDDLAGGVAVEEPPNTPLFVSQRMHDLDSGGLRGLVCRMHIVDKYGHIRVDRRGGIYSHQTQLKSLFVGESHYPTVIHDHFEPEDFSVLSHCLT